MQETLEITKILVDAEANKTTIGYNTFNDTDLNNRTQGNWLEDGQLDKDAVLALAQSRADAGINVVLNLNSPSEQPQGDGSVK